MKRIFLLLATLLIMAASCFAQWTTVTASHIYGQGTSGGGVLLPSGTILFTATDQNGNPIAYQVGGIGQQINWPLPCSIVNGAILANCQVADTTQTLPVDICYSITIKDAYNRVILGGGPKSGYQCAQPFGATWSFDGFIPYVAGWPLATFRVATTQVPGIVKAPNCLAIGSNYFPQSLNSDGSWNCALGGGSGNSATAGPNFGAVFSSQTTVTVLGTSHQLNTANLLVACYDNSSPANAIQPASWTVDPSTFNVVINFATPQSGYCAINGTGPGVFALAESSSSTWTIPESVHGLGKSVQVRAYDSNGYEISPGSTHVDTSGNVTIGFAVPQAGTVVISQ